MMNAALRKTCSSASGKRGFHPCFCLRLVLGIPSESGSARLGHIPSLPWESQLPLKPYLSLQPFIFEGNCNSFNLLLDSYCCLLPTLCRGQLSPNVINLKRLLNGKQNVWKYQNGEEKSDSDGREKDV